MPIEASRRQSTWLSRLRGGRRVDALRDLTIVPPRAVWRHEEHDFSAWIAANIAIVARAVGIPSLTVTGTEQAVGPFFADIVARDPSGRLVVIENQLESSDHDHLGKMLTYIAGLDAQVGIWIVPVARDEHRRAVQWLNTHTDSGFCCCLVTVEVVQVAGNIAPRFTLVVGPDKDRGSKKGSGFPTGHRSRTAP